MYLQGHRKIKVLEVLVKFFGLAPYFDLEILGVLNANILHILRNTGGAITPTAPLYLYLINTHCNLSHLKMPLIFSFKEEIVVSKTFPKMGVASKTLK